MLQQLVNGLTIGSTYAIFAVGYTLILGVLGVINMAHGEVFMLSAYAGLMAAEHFKANIFVALLAGMLTGAVLGVILEFLVFRPLRRSNTGTVTSLIGTIGISITMQSIAQQIWGSQTRSFPADIPRGSFQIAGVTITYVQLFAFLTAFVLMAVIGYMINRTRTGRAIRATAENPEAAAILGVNTSSITLITMALASALAGVAGVLIGLLYNSITPFMGSSMSFKGLAVIIFGGLGNVKGAVIGGFILGLAEVLTVALGGSNYRDAVSFILILLVLFFKPNGLFGSIRKGGRF